MCNASSKKSTGRMDPWDGLSWVGSSRAGSGWVTILPDLDGSDRHFGIFSFCNDYFLVPESI